MTGSDTTCGHGFRLSCLQCGFLTLSLLSGCLLLCPLSGLLLLNAILPRCNMTDIQQLQTPYTYTGRLLQLVMCNL